MVQRKTECLKINRITEQSKYKWDGIGVIILKNLNLKVEDRLNMTGYYPTNQFVVVGMFVSQLINIRF
jgi:hypothetical protein